MAAGEDVTLGALAEELGVSKGTVRNAVAALGLRESGHVRAHGGRGTLFLDAHAASAVADRIGQRDKPAAMAAAPTAPDADAAAIAAELAEMRGRMAERDRVDAANRELMDRYKKEIDSLRNEVETLRAKLDASIEQERRTGNALQAVAGAGLWRRIRGFKGLLGSGE